MKKSFILIGMAGLTLAAVGQPALAERHDHDRRWGGGDIRHFHEHDYDRWRGGRWVHDRHDGRLGWWWIVAGMWYFYPAPVYPYPNPYEPPVVLVEQAPPAPPPVAAPPAPPQYWYYCQNPAGYYPYVAKCRGPWQAVPATPPR